MVLCFQQYYVIEAATHRHTPLCNHRPVIQCLIYTMLSRHLDLGAPIMTRKKAANVVHRGKQSIIWRIGQQQGTTANLCKVCAK